MVLRMIVGLLLTAAAFAVFGRRLWWLKRLAFSGRSKPVSDLVRQVASGRES